MKESLEKDALVRADALAAAIRDELERAEGVARLAEGDDPAPSTRALVIDAGPREPAPPIVERARPAPSSRRPVVRASVIGLGVACAAAIGWHWRHPSSAHAFGAATRATGLEATVAGAPSIVQAAAPPASGMTSPSAAKLEALVAPRATPQPTTGTIRVTVKGHRVFIDGRFAGDGPGTFAVSGGEHEVRVGSVGALRAMKVPRGGEVVIETTGYGPEKIDDVRCSWERYRGAWACPLPSGFVEGRFNTPPDFRHDEASREARHEAWLAAGSARRARVVNHVGVFVPDGSASWLFVPGRTWSPGDPMFLPR